MDDRYTVCRSVIALIATNVATSLQCLRVVVANSGGATVFVKLHSLSMKKIQFSSQLLLNGKGIN